MSELQAACPGMELRTVAIEALSDFDRDDVDITIRMARSPFPASLEAWLLFRQEIVAVASPHLVKELALPLSDRQRWSQPNAAPLDRPTAPP